MFNRGTLTECPVCQGLDPDPRGRGFCGLCGAVYRNWVSSLLRFAKTAVALGIVLLVTAAVVTLVVDLSKLLGLALFAIGAVLLAAGLFFSRRVSSAMLAALALRTAPDTLRFLRTTERLHLFVLAFGVLGLLAAGPYYVRVAAPRRQQAQYQALFSASMPHYVTIVPTDAPVPEDVAPYIRGKAVVVDKTDDGGTLSEVHLALPEELRARSPDDVGTVVWVQWKDFRFGTYGGDDGIVAYRVDADVAVIDAATSTVVARETFHGGNPPETAPSDGSPGRGPRPVQKIVAWLKGLNRRAAEKESSGS